jgi:hypothetical protein
MTPEELAALILAQTREVIADAYGQAQADIELVNVIPGRVYTKIDRGPAHNPAGFLMIENATGEIFGIKAYGKVHKGHRYGTLATAAEWFWGDGEPVRPAQPG